MVHLFDDRFYLKASNRKWCAYLQRLHFFLQIPTLNGHSLGVPSVTSTLNSDTKSLISSTTLNESKKSTMSSNHATSVSRVPSQNVSSYGHGSSYEDVFQREIMTLNIRSGNINKTFLPTFTQAKEMLHPSETVHLKALKRRQLSRQTRLTHNFPKEPYSRITFRESLPWKGLASKSFNIVVNNSDAIKDNNHGLITVKKPRPHSESKLKDSIVPPETTRRKIFMPRPGIISSFQLPSNHYGYKYGHAHSANLPLLHTTKCLYKDGASQPQSTEPTHDKQTLDIKGRKRIARLPHIHKSDRTLKDNKDNSTTSTINEAGKVSQPCVIGNKTVIFTYTDKQKKDIQDLKNNASSE